MNFKTRLFVILWLAGVVGVLSFYGLESAMIAHMLAHVVLLTAIFSGV